MKIILTIFLYHLLILNVQSQTASEYVEIGVSKYEQGDYNGAILNCNKSLELDSVNFWAYYTRGKAKMDLGDNFGAIKDFNISLELRKDKYSYDAVYLDRGVAKSRLDDYRGAIADFGLAIEHNPKYGEAYFKRAAAKFILGFEDDGCWDLSKAGELGYLKAYEAIKRNCN